METHSKPQIDHKVCIIERAGAFQPGDRYWTPICSLGFNILLIS